MKKLLLSVVSIACVILSFAQDVTETKNPSPYHTSFKVDGPIIIGNLAVSALGLSLIQNKDSLTPAQVQTKTIDKVPFFDRSSAGWYSEQANDDSYIPFYGAFAMPLVMMVLDNNERQKAGQVLVLYSETMAITSTLFTLSAGLIDRPRPLVFSSTENWRDSEAPMDKRMSKNSQRSFFAGHTASSAAATFFAAKVFQDFNPDSKWKPFVWGVAAAIPASVGYLRYKAGQHFLSDNILGYVIGGATGVLVPQLHKNKMMENVSIYPAMGLDSKGIAVVYHIK